MQSEDNIVNNIWLYAIKKKGVDVQIAPYSQIDKIVEHYKPDVYYPINNKNTENNKLWVITNVYNTCFEWKHGECSKKNCRYPHSYNKYISVHVVEKPNMITIYKKKIYSIEKNMKEKNIQTYVNPFTGLTEHINQATPTDIQTYVNPVKGLTQDTNQVTPTDIQK